MRRKIYQEEKYKSQRQDQEEVKEAKRVHVVVFEGTTFVQRKEIEEDVEDTTQTGKEKTIEEGKTKRDGKEEGRGKEKRRQHEQH